MKTFAFLVTAASLLLAGLSPASAQPATTAKSSLGGILAGDSGMTLYTFDKDSDGASACYDKCAANWPPLAASDGDKAEGDYSVVARKDGVKQWAYKGKPLYFFAKDKKAGDVTGENVNDVWHVARP